MPGTVEMVINLVLWMPALVLFTVVVTGPGRAFRLALLLFGLVEPAGLVFEALAGGAEPLILATPAHRAVVVVEGVAAFVMMVMMLLAQRRDGRWSRATLLIGAGTFASAFLVVLVDALTRGSTFESIAEAMDVLYVVWLGRTARELNREPTREAPLIRGRRCALASRRRRPTTTGTLSDLCHGEGAALRSAAPQAPGLGQGGRGGHRGRLGPPGDAAALRERGALPRSRAWRPRSLPAAAVHAAERGSHPRLPSRTVSGARYPPFGGFFGQQHARVIVAARSIRSRGRSQHALRHGSH
ncbi:hypothetical protein [Nonomuraea coxensis]|uniref:hypothetical protein n=1 Tax=Nonomuraea coxensis TaxID=404386 RepID=UPI00037D2C6D|nr:hypothetical protein [Nonomuraea coxensis]